ncbi:MAG: GumC family protein, partial [Planctomycetota bacterium]
MENGNVQEAAPGGEPAEVNLRDYLRIVIKHVWVIIVFFVVVVVAVAVHTFRQPKIYRATSRINIRREVPELSQLQTLWNFYSTQQEYMETQYKIIASRKIAKKAFIKLKLGESTPDAVEGFRKGIVVEPVKDTFLVDVSFDGPDPAAVARYVNEIVSVYIDSHNLEKASQSMEAEDTIAKEMPNIIENLNKAERELREFQEKNNLLSFEESKARHNRELDNIVDEVQRLEKDLLDFEVKKRRIERSKGQEDLFSLDFVLASRIVNELKIQISNLNEQYIELKSQYKIGREIDALKEKISDKSEELTKEVKLLTTGTLERYDDIQQKLTKRLEEKAAVSLELNDLERKKFTWDRLQNEVTQQ